MPAPLIANKLRLTTPALPATCPSQGDDAANVYSGCIAMAHGDAFVQPHKFDSGSDPEGEAPEEVQTLRLQQDVSQWLVCLNNVSLYYVLLQLLPCS